MLPSSTLGEKFSSPLTPGEKQFVLGEVKNNKELFTVSSQYYKDYLLGSLFFLLIHPKVQNQLYTYYQLLEWWSEIGNVMTIPSIFLLLSTHFTSHIEEDG